MDVWLVTIGEPLPIQSHARKLRTAYLADELVSRNCNVTWWTSAFDHFNKKWICHQDQEININSQLTLIALKGCGYKKNISLSRFIDHRIIAYKFRQFAKRKSLPDIIIVSLPTYDLAYEAVSFSKKNSIPVIVDVRDKWPDIFLEKIPLPKILSKMFLWNDFYKVKNLLRNTSHLVTVSHSFMQWALKLATRKFNKNDKIFYLGYRKDTLQHTEHDNEFNRLLESIKSKFVVVFIGTFEAFHDPSAMIECARLLQSDPSIHFVLAGKGKLLKTLTKKAKDLKNISFAGWLNQSQIDLLLKHSKIGMCPTSSNEDLFPNKAFAYFSEGLPVISSFEGDLKNLLHQHQMGFYCEPNNIVSMANYIAKLGNDNNLYQTMKKNALSFYDKHTNGWQIYKDYADHIQAIVNEAKNEKAV